MNRSHWIALIGTFTFLGFLIYAASLSNGFVRWDDGLLIYENPFIRGINIKNLWAIFSSYDPELYIPLTLFSYQIDFAVAGTNAGFYHLHSLALHIINAILIVWVLKKLTGNTWVSIVTGLLFLVHPLNTEAVAWASGRKDLLSTLWFLVSVGCYLGMKGMMGEMGTMGKRRLYILSLVTFVLALLSKVTVLTLPAVLVLVALFQKRKLDRAFWMELLPYVELSILFAIIAYFGKTGVIDASTGLEKILIAPLSTVFYLQKLVLPLGLSVIYPLTGSIELMSMRIVIPLIICAGLIVVGLKNLNRNPLLFFCLAFFAITLSPSLLNFSKGGFLYFASDRYAYLAGIGILLLIASFIFHLSYRNVVASIFVIIFGVLATQQSFVWANSESLFTHTLKHYPDTHSAHNNLGNMQRARGEIDAAIASYVEAKRITEEFGRGDSASIAESKITSNMASAFRVTGDTTHALKLLQEAEELNSLNANVPLGKGIIFASQGNISESESQYQKAIEMRPNFTTAKINLASLYVQTRRYNEAIATLEQALEENPFYPQAWFNLGVALRHVERNREAKDAYEEAVDLEPAFVAARINLGILYAERKDIEEAIEQFQAVLRYDPENARARSALQQLGVR